MSYEDEMDDGIKINFQEDLWLIEYKKLQKILRK